MDTKDSIIRSQDLFSKILSFFPRIDAKNSSLLAIDAAMLGFLVTKIPPLVSFTEWYMFIPIIPAVLLAVSLWFIYHSAFPVLEGGSSSLIYFREIANRTESKFIQEFKAQSEEDYLNDVLGQIWRNSEIAKKKYEGVKIAFNFLALSVIPWLISLAIFISKNSSIVKVIK
jgi:hypothetical protein